MAMHQFKMFMIDNLENINEEIEGLIHIMRESDVVGQALSQYLSIRSTPTCAIQRNLF